MRPFFWLAALAYPATAWLGPVLVSPAPIWSQRTLSIVHPSAQRRHPSKRPARTCPTSREWSSYPPIRGASTTGGENQDSNSPEHDFPHPDTIDIELENLLQGLNIGSPKKGDPATARRGELDEESYQSPRGSKATTIQKANICAERLVTTGERCDLMKIIMALRKQMGEEDFYRVFDPRNPRIGDI